MVRKGEYMQDEKDVAVITDESFAKGWETKDVEPSGNGNKSLSLKDNKEPKAEIQPVIPEPEKGQEGKKEEGKKEVIPSPEHGKGQEKNKEVIPEPGEGQGRK